MQSEVYKLLTVAMQLHVDTYQKKIQATTTKQTTCSQCSYVATWPDYMTLQATFETLDSIPKGEFPRKYPSFDFG